MEKPIIDISEGKIQGTILKSVYDVNYFAFKGIPFAQPPLGELRFKAPQPPLKWSGIRDASEYAGDIAMQNDTMAGPKSRGIFGGEDCLYLNVYTNAIGCKRPVMVYIHGGGFVEGSGNDIFYGEDYFMNADIVLVCINYRLGPFGFLNLGHEVASGNQGVRDILFSLKWVQRNIEAFGGDPNNVTIFGNSAGSVISHLFTLIPAARGLFHKAILQSGTMLADKQIMKSKEFKNGYKIASLLGMDSNDPIKVIEFLRTVPARDLVALENKILTEYECKILWNLPYTPIIDANYTEDPVIPLPIQELAKTPANVPIIIGHTAHECLLLLTGQYNDETYQFYDKNIKEIVKSLLLIKDENQLPHVEKLIEDFYLKDRPINKDTIWTLINVLTDLGGINYNRKVIDSRNERTDAPTYVYKFTYMGNEPTIYQYDQGPQPVKGVAHADELSYMFYLNYMRQDENLNQFPKEGTQDKIVMERFIRMWYNFALSGNPTPKLDDTYITTIWKPSTKDHLYYLEIGNDLTLKDDKDSDSRKIYDKFSSLMWY